MKKIIMACIVLLIPCSFALAHEGHAHDSSEALKSLKGGLVQKINGAQIEVVLRANLIKIYILNTQTEKPAPLGLADCSLTATAKIPHSKNSTSLILSYKDDHHETSFDAKGAHRYDLILKVKPKSSEKAESLTFVIEPKR